MSDTASLQGVAAPPAADGLGARLAPWLAEARAVAVLGGPLILTQLAQMAMPTTDMLLIGYLGGRLGKYVYARRVRTQAAVESP